jgi:hypothetical protein
MAFKALNREELRRPVGGVRSLMNMFGGGGNNPPPPQPQPQPQTQGQPQAGGQLPAAGGGQPSILPQAGGQPPGGGQPPAGGTPILPQAGQGTGQAPAAQQLPGQEMLGAAETPDERGRFAGEQIQGEGKSFLERLAPTLLGVGGAAVAGLVGGQGAAADFGTSFMATTKQLNDEKKAEGQQNLTRFESALRDGRLEEAYSLINSLPGDMMEGALRQLKDSDVKEMEAEEGGYMDNLTAATTVAQIEAVIERANTSDTMDGRGKATIQKASRGLIADLRAKAEAAKKLEGLTIEEKEKRLLLLQNQVDGIDRANDLKELELTRLELTNKELRGKERREAIAAYRRGEGSQFAEFMGVDLTTVDNVLSSEYKARLVASKLHTPDEIKEYVFQYENARKDRGDRQQLAKHTESIFNTIDQFSEDKLGWSVDRVLTQVDIAEEEASIKDQVDRLTANQDFSDVEIQSLRDTSLAELNRVINEYKQRKNIKIIPKTDQPGLFSLREGGQQQRAPAGILSQILPTL